MTDWRHHRTERLRLDLPVPGDAGDLFAIHSDPETGWGAADVDPSVPVLAFLLEHNEGSRRTAERIGLDLVWRGPDAGNPDPGAVRLVYSDRPLDATTLEAVVTQP